MANWGKIYCSSWWGDDSNKDSLPTSQFDQCSAGCYEGVSYPFSTKTQLQTAVDLWVSDNASAICNYGQINTWNVSAITNMSELFKDKTTFNDDISNWDVSNVTNMNGMFYNAQSFNQDIGSWDVSKVTNMTQMFNQATSFNKGLNNWNVSNVTSMFGMFEQAIAFNGNIDAWNVSSVRFLTYMFTGATIFNKNLSSWNIVSVENATDVFVDSALSTLNYNALLNGWSALTVQPNVIFGAGTIQYSAAGQTARGVLTSTPNNWTITDGGII